jgi:carbonic anhydrase/acetyltransferase-like protein (isoleucine patch superfamily)
MHTAHGLPVILKKGVTVGHRAVVHGSAIGSYTLIGMNATLLDGSVVGSKCLIGAGSLVRERANIPDGQLAVGLPAKVVRPLTPEEIKMVVDRAATYIDYANQYKKAILEAGH